jgi:hypothetical protein
MRLAGATAGPQTRTLQRVPTLRFPHVGWSRKPSSPTLLGKRARNPARWSGYPEIFLVSLLAFGAAGLSAAGVFFALAKMRSTAAWVIG